MKAREYLRTIQKLESETKECYGQAEYLKNAINNLSNQNAIETVEELIVDLMDEASDYAIHRVHLINELLNVDDPMQLRFSITATASVTAGIRSLTS